MIEGIKGSDYRVVKKKVRKSWIVVWGRGVNLQASYVELLQSAHWPRHRPEMQNIVGPSWVLAFPIWLLDGLHGGIYLHFPWVPEPVKLHYGVSNCFFFKNKMSYKHNKQHFRQFLTAWWHKSVSTLFQIYRCFIRSLSLLPNKRTNCC